jgi:hypothetical protein
MTGAKAVSKDCGNHGSCPYCRSGREYRDQRRTPEPPEREEKET